MRNFYYEVSTKRRRKETRSERFERVERCILRFWCEFWALNKAYFLLWLDRQTQFVRLYWQNYSNCKQYFDSKAANSKLNVLMLQLLDGNRPDLPNAQINWLKFLTRL